MIIAIQQPEHLPWVGFFNKMTLVDEFIYLDNVQFKKRYFENRNKIRTAKGWEWCCVPVMTKGSFSQEIKDVQIDYIQNWQRKYLNKLKSHYGKTKYFAEVFAGIEGEINKNHPALLGLNIGLITWVRNYLGITTKTALASQICSGKGSDLILGICLKRKADTYFSGPDGRNYLKSGEFDKAKIALRYHDFTHPVYKQKYESFISHMSIVDLLFNYGKDACGIVRELKNDG
ncbi:MAG: WbqC family protein [Candidatus Omnitrophota bacterium]|jgi:hypothetical protein